MSEATNVAVSANVLFLCLARDCEATLPSFFEYVKCLRSSGCVSRVLIGENGSTDHSRIMIESAGEGIQLVDTSSMATGATRLERMGLGRELLLHTAMEKGFLNCDFVCVADLDNVMTNPPTIAGLNQAFARLRSDQSIFAVSAMSEPFYYDLLALRAPGHDYRTLHTEIQEAKKHPLTYFRFQQEKIYRKQLSLRSDQEIFCESAFNGICIYRAQEYGKGSYLSSDPYPVAEHVHFNQSIARQTLKHMIISPQLMLKMPVDHMPVGPVRFWLDRLYKHIKKVAARSFVL